MCTSKQYQLLTKLCRRNEFISLFYHFQVNFTGNDILEIIRAPDIRKTLGHEEIPVRMTKIFDAVIMEPLPLIYKNCIEKVTFPGI